MEKMLLYPRKCRENIRRLSNEIGTSPETTYMMMLMTAALMDLDPGTDEVADIILEDCGISPDVA